MNEELKFFVKIPKKKYWGWGVRVDVNKEVKIL